MNETTVTRSRRIDSGEPLFLYDPPQDGLVAYAVFTAVCDNPECSCTRMYLDIFPTVENAHGEFETQSPALEGEISSDGSDLALVPDRAGTFTPEGIEWLKGRLAKEGSRAWISERWRRMRGRIGDPSYHPPAPPSDLEWLIPFYDLFPYEYDLVVIEGRKLYLAEDHYCLRPGCSCDEAVVVLIEGEKSRALGHVRVPVHRLRAATFEGDPEIEDLWAAFLEQHEPTVLRERYEQLRNSVRRLMRSPGTLGGPKVGRNALCPCGSGKKFKRCCGGALS